MGVAGKGQKDRVVPIGDRAIAWLEKYLDEARPEFVIAPDEGSVCTAPGSLDTPSIS